MSAEACLFVDDVAHNCEGAAKDRHACSPLSRQRAGDLRDSPGCPRAELSPAGLAISCPSRRGPRCRVTASTASSIRRGGERRLRTRLQGIVFGDARHGLASSPRKPAASLSASRRYSPAKPKASIRKSRLGSGWPTRRCAGTGSQHREVMLVQLGERLRVVGLQFGVGNLDPGTDRLAEQLPAGLAADRVGDRAGVRLGLQNQEPCVAQSRGTVDGKAGRGMCRFAADG